MGAAIVRPRLGETFFRLLMNSLTTASSLGLKTTAQLLQEGVAKAFHFLKQAAQSAFSSLYVALLPLEPRIVSGLSILALNWCRSSANFSKVFVRFSGSCLVYSPILFIRLKLARCSSERPVMLHNSGIRKIGPLTPLLSSRNLGMDISRGCLMSLIFLL